MERKHAEEILGNIYRLDADDTVRIPNEDIRKTLGLPNRLPQNVGAACRACINYLAPEKEAEED